MITNRSAWRILSTLLLASLAAACGGGGGGSQASTGSATMTSITVSPATVNIAVGKSAQLTATASYSDGTQRDVTTQVSWSSSNVAVATVSRTGLVTVLSASASPVTITASSGNMSGYASVVSVPLYRLSIHPFGQGTTVDSSGALNCGNICSAQYSDATAVTLTATPATGWNLDHWVGCDNVSGNVCALTVTADRNVYPTFTTITTTLAPQVRILDNATMGLLQNQAGSTLIFDSSATNVASLQPGDLIVSQTGNGLARRVTSVTVLTGSSIFVDTTPATLEDIIQDGAIAYHQKLTPNDITSAAPLATGVQLVSRPRTASADAGDQGISIEISHDEGSLTVQGSATFTLEPDLAISFGWPGGITEFKTAMHIQASTDLSVSCSSSLTFLEKEIPLATLTFAPMLFGPVPVVTQVVVELKITGESDAALTASVTYTETAAIGIHYLRSEGWSPINQRSETMSFAEPEVSASASLRGGVGPDTTFLIADVAGPDANIEVYLEVEAEAKGSASEQCVDLGLFLGFDAEAGGKVDILGWELAEYTVQLFDYKWPLKSADLCQDNQPPAAPTNLIAVPLSSTAIQLSWDPPTGDLIIEAYKIYRDGTEVAETAAPAFIDTQLRPSTQYCYRVSAVDVHGKESAQSEVACATTKKESDTSAPTAPTNLQATALSTSAIQLTWNASSDDTGVTGYTVERTSIRIMSVSGLTATDMGLKAATQYCYTVTAHDEAGNVSPLSNEACATTQAVGAWDVYVKCEGEDYQVRTNLDLNEMITNTIQVSDTGTDYDGTPLAFVISGTYDDSSTQLDAQITWTFQGEPCVRVDQFTAILSGSDTGDIQMDQIQVCGCTADIRFVRSGGTPLASYLANGRRSATRFFGHGPAD